MSDFNNYIESILKEVSVSKTKKEELRDEMEDHLEMSRKEYLLKGFNKEDAVKCAIRDFGEENKLKSKYKRAIMPHKKNLYILYGLLSILFIIQFLLPLLGVGMASRYYSVEYQLTTPNTLSTLVSYILIFTPVTFIPLGFYMPVICRWFDRFKVILPLSVILSLLYVFTAYTFMMNFTTLSTFNNISLLSKININSVLYYSTSFIFGFLLFKVINKASYLMGYLLYTKQIFKKA